MSTESISDGSTNRGCAAGCFKGCLILTILLVVLLAGSVITVRTVGRTYVNRQIDEVQAQHPLVGLAVELLGVGTTDPASRPDGPVTVGRKPGSADKTWLPADIPVYEPAVVESYSIGDTHVAGFQRVSEQSDAVVTYFREEMSNYNWELVAERDTETALILSWTKDNRSCQTEIVPATIMTEIWIRCSTLSQ